MSDVVWTAEALARLDDIKAYIANDSPAAADEMIARLLARTRAARHGRRVVRGRHGADGRSRRPFSAVAPLWRFPAAGQPRPGETKRDPGTLRRDRVRQGDWEVPWWIIEGRRTLELETAALSGRQVPDYQRDDIRELLERPYRIIYQLGPDRVEILTVMHYRQLLPRKAEMLQKITED